MNRQLQALCHRQEYRCYWCGYLMRLLAPAKGETQPDDMATIDHLDSRFSSVRGKNGDFRRVAACRECNNKHGQLENEGIPIEEQRKRSQNGHKKDRNG